MLRVLKLHYKVASSLLHDPRRGLPATKPNRTLACISRARHARSPQRVARAKSKIMLACISRIRHARSPQRAAGQIALSPAFRSLDAHDSRRGLPATGTNRTLACISRTRHARSPQRVARAKSQTHSRLHFAHSTRTICAEGCAGPGQNALSPASRALDTHDLRRGLPAPKPNRTRAIPAEGCPRPGQIALSPAFRALDTHDLRRGLPAPNPKRILACVSRTRHARSPQRVAPDRVKTHSRLHFAYSTRMISAEGCPRQNQIALSPAFRALDTLRSPQTVARDRDKSHSRLHFARSTRTISAEGGPRQIQNALSPAFRAFDTHDLRRGLRRTVSKRTLACISRTRHARSPQRVARAKTKSHSRLHFAHSTRTIPAEGCPRQIQNALPPAFRALDTHDLCRGLPAPNPKRTLACISQRVARDRDKSHSRLHFATRAIPAEGCPRPGQIALSPAFRASDTHDLRRGSRFVAVRRHCPGP